MRHLLPGAMPAIMVTASLDVGNLVLTLAGLSFLGLGAPAPAPELGAMAARGLHYLLQEWWVPVMPATRRRSCWPWLQPRRRRPSPTPTRVTRVNDVARSSIAKRLAAMVVILLVLAGGCLLPWNV